MPSTGVLATSFHPEGGEIGVARTMAIADWKSSTVKRCSQAKRDLFVQCVAMFPDGTMIVGFDPGLNTTGYGVVEVQGGRIRMKEAGVVRGGSNRSLEARLVEIHTGVS